MITYALHMIEDTNASYTEDKGSCVPYLFEWTASTGDAALGVSLGWKSTADSTLLAGSSSFLPGG